MKRKDKINSRYKRRFNKLDARIAHNEAIVEVKQANIDAHVSILTHLNDETKSQLTKYLNTIIVNNNMYSFVDKYRVARNRKDSVEYNLYNDNRQGEARLLFEKLTNTDNKEEYDSVVNEIYTLYIPDFVNKDEILNINKDDKASVVVTRKNKNDKFKKKKMC